MLRNVVEGLELASGRRNQNLVIKVANPKSIKDWEWFIKESKHEASVQMSLQNAQAYVRCSGGGRVVIKGKHLVPRLFFAGSHRTYGVFIHVMEIASGKSLDEFNAPGASMSPEMFVAIEKAVVSLWMLGYAHGDLHFGNLMYDTKRKTITIIDFGMSVKIPLDIRKRIRAGIKSMKNAVALWKETGAQEYVHAVMSQRGRRWLNDDGKLLQVAYSMVPEDLRPAIRNARKALWNKCSWV
jgi:serine/threonine protein kinase